MPATRVAAPPKSPRASPTRPRAMRAARLTSTLRVSVPVAEAIALSSEAPARANTCAVERGVPFSGGTALPFPMGIPLQKSDAS